MKILFIALSLLFSTLANAGDPVKAKIKVTGNCGMCKKTIEKAARDAGADKAVWSAGKQSIQLKFDPDKTTLEKIEAGIAAAGYDTENKKGDDTAYKNLPKCCKYRP